MKHGLVALCAALAVQLGWPDPHAAFAESSFPGPVQARVLDVHDGDTFLAEALVWPGQSITIHVRLRGIDAPEIRSRCEAERRAAARARDALTALMASGTVSISNISGAKYYGRVLADVSSGGSGVAQAMLARGLVRTYSGGRRESWCG